MRDPVELPLTAAHVTNNASTIACISTPLGTGTLTNTQDVQLAWTWRVRLLVLRHRVRTDDGNIMIFRREVVMHRAMTAITLIAALPSAVTAELKPHGWNPSGTGKKSCGSWVAAERSQNDVERISQRYWLAGFIGGFNAFGPDADGDVTAKTDVDGVSQWMMNYCTAHPLDTQSVAAVKLIADLRVQSAR